MITMDELLSKAYGEDPAYYGHMDRRTKELLQGKAYKYWKPDLPPTRPFKDLRMDEVATMSEATRWMKRAGWVINDLTVARRTINRFGIFARTMVRYSIVQIDQLQCIPVTIPTLPEQPIAIDRLVGVNEAAEMLGTSRQSIHRKSMITRENPLVTVTLRNATDAMYVLVSGGQGLMTLDMHDEYYKLVAAGLVNIE